MAAALIAIVLAGLLSILVYVAKTGVGPVPSTQREITAAIELLRDAGIDPQAKIYELGCGWASLALGLSRAFPEASIVGFELSPLPYLVAKLRTLGHRRIVIKRRDFRRESLK